MGCLLALIALFSPRLALAAMLIFTNMIGRALDGWIVPVLGFLLVPWTTLAYVVFYDSGRAVEGLEWFLVGLAFVFDLSSWGGGRYARS